MNNTMNNTPPIWHHLSTETLTEHLEVDAAYGLSEHEAANRREKFGLNRLTPKKGKSAIMLFLSQFHHSLIYILLVSGLVTGFLKSWLDASVIFGVVLVNAISVSSRK